MIDEKKMLWDMVKLLAKEQEPLRETIYKGFHDYIDKQERISVQDAYMAGRMDMFWKIAGMIVHMEVWEKVPEKKTNYERICSMSRKEMVDFLWNIPGIEESISFCKRKTVCDDLIACEKKIPTYMCKDCLEEWLNRGTER